MAHTIEHGGGFGLELGPRPLHVDASTANCCRPAHRCHSSIPHPPHSVHHTTRNLALGTQNQDNGQQAAEEVKSRQHKIDDLQRALKLVTEEQATMAKSVESLKGLLGSKDEEARALAKQKQELADLVKTLEASLRDIDNKQQMELLQVQYDKVCCLGGDAPSAAVAASRPIRNGRMHRGCAACKDCRTARCPSAGRSGPAQPAAIAAACGPACTHIAPQPSPAARRVRRAPHRAFDHR
jgi:hypothetical protein